MQTISEKAAAANLDEKAWTEFYRHIDAGGIVPATVSTMLREGRSAEALAWLAGARDSDFLTRDVRTTTGPNRHRRAAIARDRRHTRRRDRRAGDRSWRQEWDYVLRAA